MSGEKKVPVYSALVSEFDDGSYDLKADDKTVGEINFYDDANRIVRTMRAVNDPIAVINAMGAQRMASVDIDVVREVLAAVRKLGESN